MFNGSTTFEDGEDFAISTGRKPLSREPVEIKGRDDPANILGHVNIKAGKLSKDATTMGAKPGGYQSVVQRLTRKPLATAEKRVTIENQSFDL